MRNYIIITHIVPEADYEIHEGVLLKTIRDPFPFDDKSTKYLKLNGQHWEYAVSVNGIENYKLSLKDLVVYHSFITHNSTTYHYAENGAKLYFEDEELTFIEDRNEIKRGDTEVCDYSSFPILVASKYKTNPTKAYIDYKKGFEVFLNLKEDKKSKKLYELIHLYEFARCFEQTHRIYTNYNISMALFITILESIIGHPERCSKTVFCDQCKQEIQHSIISLEQHFKNYFGSRFKSIRGIRHRTYHDGTYFDFMQHLSQLREDGVNWVEDDKWDVYMNKRHDLEEIIRLILTREFLELYSNG